MRKTKIVCTIGPATDDDSIMRQIMLSGMNVARFNFSHSPETLRADLPNPEGTGAAHCNTDGYPWPGNPSGTFCR